MRLRNICVCLFSFVSMTGAGFAQTGWYQQTTPPGSRGLGNVQFVSANEGWIDEYSGRLLHTTDAGAHWQFVTPFPNDTVSSMSTWWVNQTHGWEMNTFGNTATHGGVLYYTTDGGGTWQRKVLATSPDTIGEGVQFVDENNGWALFYLPSIGSGITRSTDGGNTWSPIVHSSMVGSTYFVDANNGWSATRYAKGNAPLYWTITHSTDGGATWSVQYTDSGNSGATLRVIQFTDLNHGWVAGDSAKIFRTMNGGVDWTKVANTGLTPDAYSSCIFFVDSNNGWIGTNSSATFGLGPLRGILHTTDGGSSWTIQHPAFLLDSTKAHTAKLYSFFFRDADTGWFTSDYSVIGHTTDGGVTGVTDGGSSIPSGYSLSQSYPNPFNPAATISFVLPARSFVSLKVYDMLGREVSTMVSEELQAGTYTRQWNANVASGVYFYRIEAAAVDDPAKHFVETKKMLLLR